MLKLIIIIVVTTLIVVSLVAMLLGSYIVRTIKNRRNASKEARIQQEQRYRNETGRQSNQYQYNHRGNNQEQSSQGRAQQAAQQGRAQQTAQGTAQQTAQQAAQQPEQPKERRTQTATGETIIDKRQPERENKKKIFDDEDGEYVEFSEE